MHDNNTGPRHYGAPPYCFDSSFPILVRHFGAPPLLSLGHPSTGSFFSASSMSGGERLERAHFAPHRGSEVFLAMSVWSRAIGAHRFAKLPIFQSSGAALGSACLRVLGVSFWRREIAAEPTTCDLRPAPPLGRGPVYFP